MKKTTLLLFVLSILTSPIFASLPVILNSGDPSSCGPGGQVANNLASPIGNTIYDSYYTSECYYTLPSDHNILEPAIQAGNSYTLYLHFAEIFFGSGNPGSGGDGSRIFHVEVEGTRILENMDVHFAVGSSNAIVFRYDFTATTNGSVTISFIPVVENAKVSAIEIRSFGEPSDLPPTTPIIDLTSSAFPVEWIDQSIEAREDRFSLTWSTAWEVNNRGFDIQVKPAGQATPMTSIGFVEGAGDSQVPQQYEFISSPLSPGPYLVRLVQQDFDGRYSFSPLLEVQIGTSDLAGRFHVDPNPSQGEIILSVFSQPAEELTLSIFAPDGRMVLRIPREQIRDGDQQIRISLEDYPAGLYVVEALSDRDRVSRKLILR